MILLSFTEKALHYTQEITKHLFHLFIISAPVWWLFELFNSYTHNWIYDGRQYFTNLQYFFLASLSFSTVIPSVFGTAELFGTFKWLNKFSNWKKIDKSMDILIIFFTIGLILLILLIVFPKIFYPFVWLIVYFIVEPINVLLKNNSLLDFTSKKDWRPIAALAFGTLTCGFFWEFWNYFSYPQWKYYLPMVNVLHIFEMPLPGYIGYIPFSFELFALYSLITGILAKNYFKDYLQILPK